MRKFINKAFELYNNDWALVTAGNMDKFNTMTISWGGIGIIWGKDAVTVYVKPIRYTHSFLDANDYFTVSFYDDKYKDELALLGTKSGRDCDKVAEVGFTAIQVGESVTFKQAKITLLCKKIYRQDMITDTMPQDAIDKYYVDEAPHTMFIGQVVQVIEE